MSHDSFLIRPATDQDIDEIVRIRIKLREYEEKCNRNLWRMSEKEIKGLPAKFKGYIEDENSRLVVAEDADANRIIGLGLGRVQFHDSYIPGKSGKIDDIWVDEDYRRKGICKRIVKTLLEFFSDKGVEVICLNYVKGNSFAEIVWPNLGFKDSLIFAQADLNEVLERL